jgi:hypothetical protein
MTAIVSYIDYYEVPVIRNLVLSVKKNAPDLKKFMVVGPHVGQETKDFLLAHGWYLKHWVDERYAPVVTRFKAYHDLFLSLYGELQSLEWVIAVDAKDVVVQRDPNEFLDKCAQRIVAGAENVLYKDEQWGRDNITRSFPDKWVTDYMMHRKIYNAGTFAAKMITLPDLCWHVFLLSMNSQIHNPDQAAFNLLLHQPSWSNKTRFAEYDSDWALQCGTVLDGRLPQQVPVDRNFWNEYGRISRSQHTKPFVLVHQYDRNPSLKAFYDQQFSEYEQQAGSQYQV